MDFISSSSASESAADAQQREKDAAAAAATKSTPDILAQSGYAMQWDDEKLDVNKQLWLQLTFFKKDDNSEKFVTLFKANYVPFGSAVGGREQPLSIMLSNMHMYFLQPKSKRRASVLFGAAVNEEAVHEEEELMSSYEFTAIKRVTVGPFYQWFRVEFDAQQIFLFMTRCHARTHEFIQTLRQTVRERLGFIGS
jgi:hypothetical protein